MENKQYKNAVSGRREHEVSPIVIQLPAWGHEVEQSIVSAQEADIRVQNNWNDWNVPKKKFVYMSEGGGSLSMSTWLRAGLYMFMEK